MYHPDPSCLHIFYFISISNERVKCKVSDNTDNTTYTADSRVNRTKPRQRQNIDVNRYKNTKHSQRTKQTFIKGTMEVPP